MRCGGLTPLLGVWVTSFARGALLQGDATGEDEQCDLGEGLRLALRGEVGGTALIIGANEGKVHNDPAFRILASPAVAPYFDKIFVEPMPALFRSLERNLAGLPRAQAIQAAVADEPGNVTLYCMGLDNSTDQQVAALRGAEPLGSEAFTLFSQICSLSRERLFHPYDVGRMGYGQRLAPLVTETRVPALTVQGLLENVTSPVQYVQIDVEGFDDHVVRQLPLASAAFRPAFIVFEFVLLEQHRLELALSYLHQHGYSTCQHRQNIFATRQRL